MDQVKFNNPHTTLKGENRAFVPFSELKTLWFNTGTLCNLECTNCYIESSPKNDRLSFISTEDVIPYLDEIKVQGWATKDIAFTGGEPFINPDFFNILAECLKREFNVLVLTNAHKVLNAHKKKALLDLKSFYGEQLFLRVSMDHHTSKVHDSERGPAALENTLETFKWLYDEGFNLSIAGRSLVEESIDQAISGYKRLLKASEIALRLDAENLVIFPEMNDGNDVPEITVGCWEILEKNPNDLMCATERMVVKHKSSKKAAAQACTLLAYDEEFNMGHSLVEAKKDVYLNHEFCAKFCVLGNASCSG